jgi:transposase
MHKLRKNTTLNPIREEIILLHQKNFTPKEILAKLAHHNINARFVFRTLKRFKESGSALPAKNEGRPRSKRTRQVIKAVRERIRRNPAQSARRMAKSLGLARETMRRVLNQDLGLNAYKKRLCAGLTDKNKKERIKRCKQLLKRHGGPDIIFSDEKMFTLERPLNRQNDRVYGATLSDIPRRYLCIPRYQNASAVMVFGAFSKKGKISLKFIDRGVKINKEYYKRHVLQELVIPEANKMYGDEPYVFQQDSAPAHKAIVVQEYCIRKFPDFITSQEWPASSPDLNPLDFFAWGWMLGQLNNYEIHSLDQFKEILVKIWEEMPQTVVRAACEIFFKRLKLCIKAKGERFEVD